MSFFVDVCFLFVFFYGGWGAVVIYLFIFIFIYWQRHCTPWWWAGRLRWGEGLGPPNT